MIDPNRCDEFANLLRQSSTQLIAYLQALLLDWNDAEDVFQESCLVLWEKFDEFQPGTNFLGWAMRIAQHKAMHFQRSRTRRARLLGSPDLQRSLMAVVAGRDTAAINESLGALALCMDKLAEHDRRLVQRCYGEHVSVPDVAADLGRLPESVYNSLRRIRAQLLACIQQAAGERPVTLPPTIADEFLPLLDAACGGGLTAEQQSRLESLLAENVAAQETFVDHLLLCAQVSALWKGERSCLAGLDWLAASLDGETATAFGSIRESFESRDAGRVGGRRGDGEPAAHPTISDSGAHRRCAALPPSPLLLDHFESFGGVVVSYLVVAAALALGIAASWRLGSSALRPPAILAQQFTQEVTPFARPARDSSDAAAHRTGEIGTRNPETSRTGNRTADGTVLPLPAPGEAEVQGVVLFSVPSIEPGGDFNFHISGPTVYGKHEWCGKIKFWSDDGPDRRPVVLEKIGKNSVQMLATARAINTMMSRGAVLRGRTG